MTYSNTGEGINPWDDTGQKPTDWVGSTEIGKFEASGWASTGEVANFLRETIPPTHLESCRNIQYESKPSMEYPNARGTFDCQSREINIWERFERLQGMEDNVEPLTHQVAYNAYENIKDNRPEIAEQWSELHDQSLKQYSQDGSGFVSNRASTDADTDFAETYTSYLHDPEKLKFSSPEKYEFMKQEVFSAREYPHPILSNFTYNPVKREISFGGRECFMKMAETVLPVARETLQNPEFIGAFKEAFKQVAPTLEPTLEQVPKILNNPETGNILKNLLKQFDR